MDYKGLKCEYTSRKCGTCKEVKLIHSFTNTCKDCVRARKRDKYHGDEFKFNRQPIVAVRPSDKILVKGETNKDLIKKLKELFNIELPPDSINPHCLKDFDGINYWYYKGMLIMLEKDYSASNVEKIFLSRLQTKPRDKYTRKISGEMLDKISQVLTLRKTYKLPIQEIANKVGLTKGMCNHILNGRSYSEVTGIIYKRKYNTYGEDGDVLKPKEEKSTRIYKKED